MMMLVLFQMDCKNCSESERPRLYGIKDIIVLGVILYDLPIHGR